MSVNELRTKNFSSCQHWNAFYTASDFINKSLEDNFHGLFYSICYSLYLSSVLIDAPELGCNDSWNIGRKIHIN